MFHITKTFPATFVGLCAFALGACNVADESATFSGRFDWSGASRLVLRDAEGRTGVPAADATAGVTIDRARDLLELRAGDRAYRFALPEGVAAQEGVWGFLAAEESGQPAALRAKFEQKVTDSYAFVVNEPCKAWGLCRGPKPTDPYQAQYCDGRRAVTYLREDYVDTLTLELGDSAQAAGSFRALGTFVGTRADSGQRKVGTSTCQVPLY